MNTPPIPDRPLPCPKRTWCTLLADHPGECREVPRRPLPANEFGPDAAKRRRF